MADRAGLPSVLVENFTWDWIYRLAEGRCPALAGFAGQDVLAPDGDLHRCSELPHLLEHLQASIPRLERSALIALSVATAQGS